MSQRLLRYPLSAMILAGAWCVWAAGQQPPAKSDPASKAAQGAPAKAAEAKDKPSAQEKPGAKMEVKPLPAKKGNENRTPLIARTFDGVEIRGDFYPPPEGKGRKAPCLILLHPIGPRHINSSRKVFDRLPEALQSQGYAVVTFDFRGYGESKSVDAQEFIRFNHIRSLKTADRIEAKDYTSAAELLKLVNDLVAVKIWLNKKNNSGDCNSNLIGVVALEQSAVVATAWIANELTDPNRSKEKRGSAVFIPGVGVVQNVPTQQPGFAAGSGTASGRMEGDDLACLVAVSSSNRLNDRSGDALSYAAMERWLAVLRERKVSTLAIYGANDREASTFWSRAGNWIKPPREKDRYKNSGVRPVKNTSLVGAKLLLNETLELEKALDEYLSETVKKLADVRLWSEQQGPDLATQVDLDRLLR